MNLMSCHLNKKDLSSNRIRTGYAIETSEFTAITVVSSSLSFF